jgi:glyoxylase-like metal-dependent hydrolase (beta-lactamase superfamily II)
MTQTSVSAAELRILLEQGRSVTVLDIRRADEREWTIPGSLAIDAYDAVNAGQLGPLANFIFERRPVITVCGAGRAAGRATELLRAHGIDALTLEGGMRAWSGAWNVAEATVAKCQILQVRRTGKGCLAYIVASDGAALVIDASVDAEVYVDLVATRGWKLVAVADTHIHADHLSRSRKLAALTGAQLYLPKQKRARFDFRGLGDGDRIAFGDAELVTWRTPGHTTESTTYVLDGVAALTGDTLFLNGVGRPDLQGGQAEAASHARSLHGSIQRILELPPAVLVLPGHSSAAVPFDSEMVSSTIGAIRAMPLLQLPESDFVSAITKHLPPQPTNHSQIVAANELGQWPDNSIDLEAGANRCAAG